MRRQGGTSVDSLGDWYADPGPADLRGPVRFLWWLVTSQRGRSAMAAVLGTVWMVGLTLPPFLIARAIDEGLRPKHFSTLVLWATALLAVGLLNAFIAIMRHRTMTKVRMDGAFRTVHAVVVQATRLGVSLGQRVSTGEVVTVGIGDVWVISTSLTVVGPGVGAVFAYLVIAGLLLSTSPLLAVVVILGAPVVTVAVGPSLGRLQKAGTVYREQQGGLTARMVDIVEGLRVLNGIGGKDLHSARYRDQSQRLQSAGFRVGAVASWIPALGIGLPALFLAAVTWLAARMAAEGTISIGELVAVYGYVAVLVVPVAQLIEGASYLAQSLVSARRVIAVLALEPTSPDAATAHPAPEHPADLYDPASRVEVATGRLTALAGARTAEAAAIIDRLAGFGRSDATWGGVRLDGIPPAEVRRRILVADNEAAIFAGSLREVIEGRAGRDDTAVAAALHAAAAEDIVAGLPDGLGSDITPQARNVSGGQRQRIRLARALLADPEVLLAVEPTSALDAHTEAVVAGRFPPARAGRTTLVATTSPLLLDQADVVHHLAEGRVVATGTHRELLASWPDYRLLVSRSMGDEQEPAPARAERLSSGRSGA